jgi:GDP-4-dehydro-6-deoxy-D-mannose reductase
VSTALVTGSHGFVGSHLRDVLHDRGWDVVGLGRADRQTEAAADGERYVRADLTDTAAVIATLDAIQPAVVFHLAASPAFREAETPKVTELVADTVASTFSLMSAVASTARPLVVVAGSSAQYGPLPVEENPITEDSRCNPVTPYGWAKSAAEATARAFAASGSVDVIPVRVFNIIGPGEPPTTVASAFAARIVEVLDGRSEEVQARDLSAVRDFTDVRDVAAGFVDIAERGTPGRLYNLCSGRPTAVSDVLDGLLAATGLDRAVVNVLQGSGPGHILYQVGSAERVGAEVGWRSSIELSQSLRALLDSVRQGVAG